MNLSQPHNKKAPRWLIVFTVMCVAILEVLDSTIVTVALPHMQSALHASTDEISWVLTSYVVSAAIMIPLTGFLNQAFGRRQLFSINILGFMLSSMACGLATDIHAMVCFRLCQGLFGACLIPLSQTTLREIYTQEEQNKAMTIWGLGIMVAPILGPTLGGWITEHANWRWIFYINMPFCLVSIVLTQFVIDKTHEQKPHLDLWALLFMILGIGSLQLFLDQGNKYDWLQSPVIQTLLLCSLFGFASLTIRCKNTHKPLIQWRVYKDTNFSICSILMFLTMGSVLGLVSLQPILFEMIYHYSSSTTGLLFLPRAMASTCGMLLSLFISKRVDIRIHLSVGALFLSGGSLLYSLDSVPSTLQVPITAGIVQGFGMGLFLVPLTTYSLLSVPKKWYSDASGLFSYARMLGNSIGVSVFTTLLTRSSQGVWHQLSNHINPFNPQLQQWLRNHHTSIHSKQAAAMLSHEIGMQAQLMSFLHLYTLSAFLFLSLIPFILLLKPNKS